MYTEKNVRQTVETSAVQDFEETLNSLAVKVNTDAIRRTLDKYEEAMKATATATATATPISTQSDRAIGLKNANQDIGINPKDRIGASKVDFSLIPTAAKVELALALMDGATKYGAYNWRVEPIQARTYISAAERHLEDFKESEDFDPVSLCHHLGHLMACAAILIDAIQQSTLVDDRPINGQGADLIRSANEFIATKKPAGWGR